MLPLPILSTPSSASLADSSNSAFLSRTWRVSPPFSLCNHLSFTHYIVLSFFLPSLPAHRRIVSLRLTLKLSLSLTKAPSFHHALFVGRILIPLASLCFCLARSLFLSLFFSLKTSPSYLVQILGRNTSLSDRLYPSSVFFSFACLLLSFFGEYQPPTTFITTTVDLLRFSPEEG